MRYFCSHRHYLPLCWRRTSYSSHSPSCGKKKAIITITAGHETNPGAVALSLPEQRRVRRRVPFMRIHSCPESAGTGRRTRDRFSYLLSLSNHSVTASRKSGPGTVPGTSRMRTASFRQHAHAQQRRSCYGVPGRDRFPRLL